MDSKNCKAEEGVKKENGFHREAVERFCPVSGKNVVMLRHYEKDGERFECMSGGCGDNSSCGVGRER